MDLEALSRGVDPGLLARPRVAVDAMGGDHAPEEVVVGAVEWARGHPDVEVILVGDEARIRPFIDAPLPEHVSIVHASEMVDMHEQAAVAVRRKRDASINVCMRLVREGRADAVVTAGHTGAGVASAIVHLGRLPGVDRPALAVQMITDRGPLVLLDIGATTDSTGANLAQFAHMGSLFAERVLGIREPGVALLSIGEEAGKGDQRVQEATALLSTSNLRFLGNVEGRDLPRHPADVVVCDASIGNVVMKFFEGLSTVMFEMLRREFRRLPWGPVGYFFMRPGIGRIRRRFDYERLGGSPLLGVRGTVLITHGRARRRMIGFAVEVTATAARARIPESIAAALAPHPHADQQGSAAGTGPPPRRARRSRQFVSGTPSPVPGEAVDDARPTEEQGQETTAAAGGDAEPGIVEARPVVAEATLAGPAGPLGDDSPGAQPRAT